MRETGCWRVVQDRYFPFVAGVKWVPYGEEHQYSLMSAGEYSTEMKAALAMALLTKPVHLTGTEYQQLLALLEE